MQEWGIASILLAFALGGLAGRATELVRRIGAGIAVIVIMALLGAGVIMGTAR